MIHDGHHQVFGHVLDLEHVHPGLDAHAVAFVAAIELPGQLTQLRCQDLHPLLRGDLAGGQTDRHEPDDEGHEDDGDDDVPGEGVELGEQHEQPLEDGREEEAHERQGIRAGARGAERLGRRSGTWRGRRRRRGACWPGSAAARRRRRP